MGRRRLARERPRASDPEAGTIPARRGEARSPEELRRIVHEEFARWFGAQVAGPEAAYDGVARALWARWEQGG